MTSMLASQASVAETWNETVAPSGPVQSATILVEQAISGAVASATVIVWLHVAVLPQASVASHVRVARSRLPGRALVTVEVAVTTTSLPSQISVAAGRSNSHGLPHATMRFGTQVMVGAVESTTVTVWLTVALLPQRSVACQVRVAV